MIRPDTDELIAWLNDLLNYDRAAITALIETRVPCNDKLMDHPTVQAGEYTVGFLGILNGWCGTIEGGIHDKWGPISAVVDDSLGILSFKRTKE